MINKCPRCDHDNPDTARSCVECGAQLDMIDKIPIIHTETLETPKEELTTGSTFAGRYQIVEELGRGGMGRVYKATDTKINEKVALKLIKPEIASDKKTLERFGNELRIARKIVHKNVGRMYDINEEKGTHYITMEYVSGQDLKGLIRQTGQLAIGTSISIAKQVCEGLSEAHKTGVTHRDLKPSNIMIDREGNVRIMDFGIARSLKERGITGDGVMIGTPDYMSPEQAEAKEVDQRSDIYSLGVILYEMLTGIVPFEGDTALSVVMKHKSEVPNDPKEYNAQIPDDLSQLILKCLEKGKDSRFQSATEIYSELENIEKGIPTTDRVIPKRKPITSKEITVSFSAKRLVIPALAIIVIVILGLFIWHPWSRTEIPSELIDKPSVAVLPFEDLSPQKDQEFFCDGLAEELINRLTNIENLKVPARTSTFSFKSKDLDVREIGEELNVEMVLDGSVRKAGNKLRITAQLVKTADGYPVWSEIYEHNIEDTFALQDEISLAIVDAMKIKLLGAEKARLVKRYTENLEAYNLYLRGRFFWSKRGRENIIKSIEYFQKAIDKDPTYALAHSGLADAYLTLAGNRFVLPDKAYPRAKEAALRALELDEKLAEAHVSLAHILSSYEWEFDDADEEYKQAIKLNPNYATAHHWYAIFLSRLGQHDEAIREIKLARDLDPLAPRISANVGWVLFNARQYDQALEELKKALEFDPYNVAAHNQYGLIFMMLGRYEEADKSLLQTRNIAGESPENILNKAYLYAIMGKKADSRKVLDSLIKDSKGQYVSSAQMAAVYGALGEKDKAFTLLSKAYMERDTVLRGLKVDSLFDPLRSDPRFSELLKKIGFE